MLGLEEVTAWAAVGTSALAALLVLLGLAFAFHWRKKSERRLRSVLESASKSEELLWQLTANLEHVETENNVVREQGEQAEREVRSLRVLGHLGSSLDLDTVANRALEHVAEEVSSDAAAVILLQADEEPFTATFGLSASESERELVGMPSDLNEARAVTIRYRYSREEAENDVFRLTAGLAVPLEADERHVGTLAVFWRRTDQDPGDDEIARLEGVAELLSGPLDSARRLEEARRLADLDPVTGLQNERYFGDRLLREVARARRYERRLGLVIFRLGGQAPATEDVVAFGRLLRGAIRSADIPCHLGAGEFAVIAPESALTDAERLAERMRFAGARAGSEPAWVGLGIAELGDLDSAGSFLDRARSDARAPRPEAQAVPETESAT